MTVIVGPVTGRVVMVIAPRLLTGDSLLLFNHICGPAVVDISLCQRWGVWAAMRVNDWQPDHGFTDKPPEGMDIYLG